MRRHRRFLRLSLGLAALAVVAGACGGGGQPVAQDPSTPTTAASTPATGGTDRAATPAASVDRLFAFEAPRVTGGTFDAAELSGRDVAIWFWAPW